MAWKLLPKENYGMNWITKPSNTFETNKKNTRREIAEEMGLEVADTLLFLKAVSKLPNAATSSFKKVISLNVEEHKAQNAIVEDSEKL